MSIHQTLDTTATSATLTDAWEFIGVEPWSAEAIQAHKAAELAKAPPASPWWEYRWVAYALCNVIIPLGALVVGVMASMQFMLSCIDAVYLHLDLAARVYPAYLLWLSGATALLSIATLWAMLSIQLTLSGPARWRLHSYEKYRAVYGNIPKVVEQAAFTLSWAFPSATLFVHALEHDGMILDPILEIVYADPTTGKVETAYPFVWDEQGNILSPPQ